MRRRQTQQRLWLFLCRWISRMLWYRYIFSDCCITHPTSNSRGRILEKGKLSVNRLTISKLPTHFLFHLRSIVSLSVIHPGKYNIHPIHTSKSILTKVSTRTRYVDPSWPLKHPTINTDSIPPTQSHRLLIFPVRSSTRACCLKRNTNLSKSTNVFRNLRVIKASLGV